MEVDPDFLARYLLERRGGGTEFQLHPIHFHLRRGMTEGTIREDDPEVLGTAMLAAATSFIVSGALIPDEAAMLDQELKRMLAAYLTP